MTSLSSLNHIAHGMLIAFSTALVTGFSFHFQKRNVQEIEVVSPLLLKLFISKLYFYNKVIKYLAKNSAQQYKKIKQPTSGKK